MAYGMNTLGFTAGAMGDMLYETEEERRRRLEQEAAAQRQKLSAPTPVKQTITTDPITGEQKMTITGSPQDLSAANPNTPTIMMPGMSFEDQQRDQREQFIQQQPPVAPVVPAVVTPAPVAPAATTPAPVMTPPAPVTQPAALQPGETAGMPTSQTGIDWDNILTGGQANEKIRAKMISDPNTPAMYRRAAIVADEQNLRNQVEMNKAKQATQQMFQSGDSRAFANAIKGDGGSYIKAAVFSALGATDLARNELQKLGAISGKWQTAVDQDNRRAIINYRNDGMPTRGFDENGRELAPEELARFASAGALGKISTSGIFFQTPKGQILRSQSDERGGARLVDAATGAVYKGPTEGLMKLEEAGQYRKMDYALVTDLKKKHGQNVLDAEKEYVSLNGPFRNDAERQQFRSIYGFQQALPPTPTPSTAMTPPGAAAPVAPVAPAAPAAAPAQPVAPVAPAAQTTPAPTGAGPAALTATTPTLRPTAAPVGNMRGSLAEQRANLEARKDAAKAVAGEGAKEVAASASTQALIAKIDDRVIPTIESGEHNIGSTLSGFVGRGPIAQAIGAQFETTQAKNTKEIMETVDMLAIEGLKSLGANPSQRDLEFYTRNKPTASSDPDFVRDWLKSRSQALKEKLAFGAAQAETGGRAGVAPRPDRRRGRGEPGTKNNPIKLD